MTTVRLTAAQALVRARYDLGVEPDPLAIREAVRAVCDAKVAPFAADVDGKWSGIESLGNVDDREIAQLQSDAIGQVNASLTTDGRLVAHSLEDGSEVWSSRLPAGTNSPVAIAGDWLVTAAGFPQGSGQEAALVAFQLGGERVILPPADVEDGDGEDEDGADGEDGSG